MKALFVMELGREADKISGLQQQSSDTKTEADEKIIKRIETLKNKILAGGTTGDPIRDYVIVANETLSEETEQPYRELEEMLKGREGEQVLVVNEKIESAYRSGCWGGSGYTSVESTLRLGVLTSNVRFEIGDGEGDFLMFSLPYSKADLHGPRIILPTKRHVEKSDMGFSRYEWRLVDEKIQIPDFEFYSFDIGGERTWPEGMPFGRHGGNMNSRRELLIKIGSKDVTDYFKSKRSLYHDDFSYVRALKLLGIEDQAPGEFVIGYTKEIGEEKGDTLTRLIELLEKQGLSKSRIKRIYNIAERRGVLSEGGAVTPIKGKDDAFVVSMGSREKLNESTRNLISTLEKAVELGMHDEDLIIDGEIPGQSLNAKILVRTLCKQYEVSYN